MRAYADAKKQGAVLGWGQFLTVALNFLIIAWVLFLAIRRINKLKKEEPAAPAGPTTEEKLLAEIRDLLKKGNEQPTAGNSFGLTSELLIENTGHPMGIICVPQISCANGVGESLDRGDLLRATATHRTDDLALREDAKSGSRFTRSIPVGYGSATKIRPALGGRIGAAQPARRHYNRWDVPFMVYEVSQEGIPNVHPMSLEGSKGQFSAARWRFRTALAANLIGPGSNFAQSEGGKIQQKQRKPWPMVQGRSIFCPSET